MNKSHGIFSSVLAGSASWLLGTSAIAGAFNIPGGTLSAALEAYSAQSGIQVAISSDALEGARSKGATGDMSPEQALSRILSDTGFTTRRVGNSIAVIRASSEQSENVSADVSDIQLAQATPVSRAAVETVTVTSSKLGGGDVQSIPIAITALSQEQLTSTQTAGGPDLVKQVPNLTFSKTNFTGYNIQIRGIGTQAISVTTDPAVAVSFNDVPFLRNHFFEQEFYDVSQVEVLRGPQGTLYGRNATSGVVNLISAKPTDHWEAMASADFGNYKNRRFEGMLNVPVANDKLDLRVAGEWTKRDGYAFNDVTDHSIDGRDLWSTRVSLLVHPIEKITAVGIWEHFQEDDDRARSTKQLCKRNNAPAVVDGPAGPQVPQFSNFNSNNFGAAWLSQGCEQVSLYSPDAYQTPNAGAIPFVAAFGALNFKYISLANNLDPYASLQQQQDLRTISSAIDPKYRAKNDTVEFNLDYNLTSQLTVTSQTAYNYDSLYSTEDFNRFTTAPDFLVDRIAAGASKRQGTFVGQDNEFCDPQLGCSSRFVAQDRSSETARQFYQEVRLTSDFQGPWNFVVGGNYLNYKTSEDYYVFSNLLTLLAMQASVQISGGAAKGIPGVDAPHIAFADMNVNSCEPQQVEPDFVGNYSIYGGLGCQYVDPNPIDQVDGQGHNYFKSHNPYSLSSWAIFGETYYQIASDVKLTGGLRFTDDKKDFPVFPTWTLFVGKGYPQEGEIKQEWQEVTGRAVVNWTPKLDFTDQTLVYASFAHGYKGGGANPPGVVPVLLAPGNYLSSYSNQTHPLTFKPEFNNAFELGSKNTLLDGALTLNGDVFLYKYRNYQISQIVDRTSVNLNFDATVRGAELESTWEPVPGLRFNFAGGYENATVNNGQTAIDLMDRTAGHAGWFVVKPFITGTSNCVIPNDAVNEMLRYGPGGLPISAITNACHDAYNLNEDPVTAQPYIADPDPINLPGYAGFDPSTAPNHGEGFAKDLSGNQLPNAPHFTMSLGAQYSVPLSETFAGTLRGDFYWQSDSFARIFNDRPYDEIRGYTNLNFSLIITQQDGWQAMAYVKNVLDTTAITGAFLNSDDTALTTNVFVTDPRLFGIRLTKNW